MERGRFPDIQLRQRERTRRVAQVDEPQVEKGDGLSRFPQRQAPRFFLKLVELVQSGHLRLVPVRVRGGGIQLPFQFKEWHGIDRKSTRLNSSHTVISYA